MANVLFRHSALWAPRPCPSNSCLARCEGFPAVWHVKFHRLVGMPVYRWLPPVSMNRSVTDSSGRTSDR
eukprot:9144704-Pyramimonas_sp.AAC.1